MEDQRQEQSLTLKEVALLCECSQKVASFGILADFIKKAVMHHYSLKSKGIEMPSEEKEILAHKYDALKDSLKEIV